MATKLQQEQANVFTPNVKRLVRSAATQEVYCAFILDCLHETQVKWSLRQLENMWKRAAASELTVEEFIQQERKR